MSNELAQQQETQLAQPTSESAQVLAVIERVAANPDADIDKLERLLDMQERVMNRNAMQAFSADMAAMQAELPTVAETAKGHNNAKYAPLEKINEVIRPVLQKYGFAVTFRTEQQDGAVSITAVLSHKQGHHQESTLVLPNDTSGNKNLVQAIGSTVSYGKRYALCALLNISTGDDTDGKRPQQTAPSTLTAKQVKQLRDAAKVAGVDDAYICEKGGVAEIEDIPAERFTAALNHLKKMAQGGGK